MKRETDMGAEIQIEKIELFENSALLTANLIHEVTQNTNHLIKVLKEKTNRTKPYRAEQWTEKRECVISA